MAEPEEIKKILVEHFHWPADSTVERREYDEGAHSLIGKKPDGTSYFVGIYSESHLEHIVGNHATKHGAMLIEHLRHKHPEDPLAGTLLLEEQVCMLVRVGSGEGERKVCVVSVHTAPIETAAELRSKAPPNFLELVLHTMEVVHRAGYMWSGPICALLAFATIAGKLYMRLPDAHVKSRHLDSYADRRVPNVKLLLDHHSVYEAIDVRRGLYETPKTNLESFFYLALHMYAPPGTNLPWAGLPPTAALRKMSEYHPTVEGKPVERPEFYVDGLLHVMRVPDDVRPAIRAVGLRAFALPHSGTPASP
jgi:hypothetical protein